ncbi:multidrug resistance efflux transporter family protein [Jeotgalibacillus sp. R-1-5s-1]|uniref:DMT family transporter n=1 Tax=Jeotgalibacillus sp. R-1-5s-1 TaxID=2555897 RepID=UPI00106C7F2C|nr:multidrug resistance efflux transporter family protein [Jeotgalibacillus sp. R-1-5s-1]TFE00132.1 multidrug resistance efflux transporter family protein [Jeotgalibacillus sp. R-1-5s-1]
MRGLSLGIISSMFFAVTFILNRSMETAGGSWLWSSSLRFLFMVPFLILIVAFRKNLKAVFLEIKKAPVPWLAWSFTGFVLFYAPLTYAAAYGPGWLVAGTWQFTIIAGLLLAPFFYEMKQGPSGLIKKRHNIQFRALAVSSVILIGVISIQVQNASGITTSQVVAGILPVILAAFCYPLGNRKMMELCGDRLDTFQRILGMTLCSLPAWLVISMWAYIEVGVPQSSQVLQSLIVAICSGIIATALFFIATSRVRHDQGKLAGVEATQSTQVLFVLAGEVAFFATPLPNGIAAAGMCLIVIGIILHTFNMRNGIPRRGYLKV